MYITRLAKLSALHIHCFCFACSKLNSGSLLMDCSTIDPAIAQAMATLAQQKGAMFVDAPVSGGMSLNTALWCIKIPLR